MIETNTTARTRDAYRIAHEERGKALSQMVRWIFSRDRD